MLIPRWPRPAAAQLASVAAAGLTAVGATALAGPYGLQNFTHPLTVAGSPVWRLINEWRPPWVPRLYPPTAGFWIVLAFAVAAMALAKLGRRSDTRRGEQVPALTLFDIAAPVLALAMALWARRFVPIFCILAADIVALMVVTGARAMSDSTRQRMARFAGRGAGAGAVVLLVLLVFQWQGVYEAIARSRPGGFFAWAVEFDWSPTDGIEFIRRNNLRLNVLADWSNAAPLLFLAPGCRVFADGRAQQVYPVEHFEKFQTLMGGNFDAERTQRILDDSQTDAILFARDLTPAAGLPRHILARPDDWLLVLASPNSMLLLRRPSAALSELGRLEREGRAWWPDTPTAKATRANILLKTDPPDEVRAIDLLRAAVADDPTLGESVYGVLTKLWLRRGERDEATRFLTAEAARIADLRTAVNEIDRERLRSVLQRCQQQVDAAGTN